MPPRTAIIEDFDDDTDIPLPNVPLPNTGTHGPLLQEVGSDDDGGFDFNRGGGIPGLGSGFGGMGGPMPVPGPASPSQMQFQRERDPNAVTDVTPYKTYILFICWSYFTVLIFFCALSWTCIYPIYIDAKRPYTTGERRIARAKSIWWPLSKDIADAASRLGLGTLHEVSKSHPRDWDNPGRVRVLWKKDGRLVNSSIKSSTYSSCSISVLFCLLYSLS
jgi:signal recognition particle subunit SRP19